MQNPVALYTIGSASLVGQIYEASRDNTKIYIRYKTGADSILIYTLTVEFDSPVAGELALVELQKQLIANCKTG